MYDKFKVTNPFGVTAFCAFVEASVAFLDTPIPQDALNLVYGIYEDEEGNTVLPEPRTLRDFSLSVWPSLDGIKAIVCIGAQEFAVGRQNPVTEEDLAQWDAYITNYGFDSTKWMTKDEALTLLDGPEYTQTEEVQ